MLPATKPCLSLNISKDPPARFSTGYSCPALAAVSLPVEISRIPSHTVMNICSGLLEQMASLVRVRISAAELPSMAQLCRMILHAIMNSAAGIPLPETSAITRHHLILVLEEIINNDPDVNKYMKVVMLENYNVSYAEKLIPACDISEQISLASKEASGTGNMKFMLNGAVTLGTADGANVEISELVGKENIYEFGISSDEVIEHYAKADYVSKDLYDKSDIIKEAVDFIVSKEALKVGHKENLERLYKELLNKDWFMTLIDLEEYITVKDRMLADYEDREKWQKMMLTNIAKAGFFSSDRTIEDYNRDIWKLFPKKDIKVSIV